MVPRGSGLRSNGYLATDIDHGTQAIRSQLAQFNPNQRSECCLDFVHLDHRMWRRLAIGCDATGSGGAAPCSPTVGSLQWG